MIIHLKESIDQKTAEEIAIKTDSICLKKGSKFILINSGKIKAIKGDFNNAIEESFHFESDIQLASRQYNSDTIPIAIAGKIIGGNSRNMMVITGPCSVESVQQIESCADFVSDLGISVLRAGSFKPRTSPYTFQGLGLEGLKILSKVREKYGLKIISEARDATHIDEVIDHVDIVQVGAKAMYDQGILRKCGKAGKPILLKRGFGATLQEFVQAAEFILCSGNENVILCERGIRTFETKTRFTLDLCGVAYLKEHINLPVFLDPSHAMGYAYGVADLTRACVAMGVDGLLIESHPNPKIALSDASQQLNFKEFRTLYDSLGAIASAIGRNII
ncbi:MAG: bifunctional 3-deoxy-7-phosphoheptulonate synthase/chorismate mutase [Bacteroidetes bacterium]|nr:bifunctional 3-deoxy-7-phosphoheptulonate synthase/chorismate mutase [Bacteroidota bacterium]MDA1121881.1 bifunctional 3-deoxy-7-phosphoheptulonate synthase/chorismate mutase [Bacteroidota bacterium]